MVTEELGKWLWKNLKHNGYRRKLNKMVTEKLRTMFTGLGSKWLQKNWEKWLQKNMKQWLQ
jgi:hypothetical protein